VSKLSKEQGERKKLSGYNICRFLKDFVSDFTYLPGFPLILT
jgi:hypothetical protein